MPHIDRFAFPVARRILGQDIQVFRYVAGYSQPGFRKNADRQMMAITSKPYAEIAYAHDFSKPWRSGIGSGLYQLPVPCLPLGKVPNGPVTAVLDGQQRLTALNIGLRGSLAIKEPNKWWNNPKAFPVKKLYLELLHKPEADETGEVFRFQFLTTKKASLKATMNSGSPCISSSKMPEPSDPMEFLAEKKLGNTPRAVKTLHRLQQVVFNAAVINDYEEESQAVEKVLNIFIRTNSGGTVLSYSDLLLSIATAQWEERDARSEINDLVDSLNDTGMGFNFSKDFVLKAGLMLSDIASVGFKVENFGRANMKKLEANWPKVSDSLRLTVRLAASFGLSRDTISADSALLADRLLPAQEGRRRQVSDLKG